MAHRGGFQPPVSSVSYETKVEHERKYVCVGCQNSSTTLDARKLCWRCQQAEKEQSNA